MSVLHRTIFWALFSFLTASQAWAFDKQQSLRAVTLEYPPYQYSEGNKPAGIAVEILTEAVKRMGVQDFDVSFVPWKRAVHWAKNGEADVLFNAGKNEARQVWGRYAESVLIDQTYYLFTRKGSNLRADLSFADLSGKRIAVRRGYLYGSGPFRRALNQNVFDHVMQTDSTEASVRLLLNDRVDMFVGDFLPVMHYLRNSGLDWNIGFVRELDTDAKLTVLRWPTYFLFPKRTVGPDFVVEFTETLDEMKADQTYQRIFQRYRDLGS